MLKTLVHYFTGTGNTAHAVKLISEELKAAGHEVSVVQVRYGVVPPHRHRRSTGTHVRGQIPVGGT